MAKYIDKSALVAEIEKRLKANGAFDEMGDAAWWEDKGMCDAYKSILSFINTLEVKEVDLIIHTIIAEGCDWLATHTSLSHDEIEGCRNLMLTVKEEQLKAQKEG